MIFWFAALSVLGVFLVFRDAALDYRLVALGSLLPDPIDAVLRRGIGPAHSVTVAVAFLAAVMVATIRRRPLRRRLLALPIGVFAHLVLDGAWADTAAFWWPFTRRSVHGPVPSIGHGASVLVVEELLGAAAAFYCYRRFGLAQPRRRAMFLRSGRLDRAII